ncbi:MAG: hypothetical protein PHI90_09400, partial [Clostridia bacterium]|nr:hypothetical protein [Clostridia bacterium]MDD4049013.1 hypothetical protein [Clostridia bacterium]
MIFTKALKYEDIKKGLDKDNDIITIIGCETCVRVAGSGGEEKMKELALKLRSDGYNVKDGFMVPTACTPKISFAKLSKDVNTIVSLACSAGSSNLERSYPEYKIIETTEDIGLMITNTDKNIIKVTMPYEGHEDEAGKEYDFYTGNKRDNDNELLFSEVRK